ncbi:MAG: hypothetical protein HY885_10450 [Deltaproteobacteria bacterium]|nr:hypothetical protein [Deltaproteobacteria bacterium]
MQENDLRKIHRNLGIFLALFLFLQGGSGLLIAAGELFGFDHHEGAPQAHHAGQDSYPGEAGERAEEEHGLLGQIHHKDAAIWHIYRILVGTGLMAQLITGIVVFMKIEGRRRHAGKN